MKVECTIDEKKIIADLNSHMSLLDLIKSTNINRDNSFCSCQDKACMNCLVFITDENLQKNKEGSFLFPACLFPIFRLNKKRVVTKNLFFEMAECEDVLKAFSESRITPCSNCYGNKIMIFSFLIDSLISIKRREGVEDRKSYQELVDMTIKSHLQLSSCACLSFKEAKEIAQMGVNIRLKRLGKWTY